MGTNVQSYPCRTLATASFISVLSSCLVCGTADFPVVELSAGQEVSCEDATTPDVVEVTVAVTDRESIFTVHFLIVKVMNEEPNHLSSPNKQL